MFQREGLDRKLPRQKDETNVPVTTEKKPEASPTATQMQMWRPFENLRREVDRLFEDFTLSPFRLPFRRPAFDIEPFFLFEMALHSSPQIFIDDRCVFSRERFALVDDLASVDSVLQHEVKRPARKPLAAIGAPIRRRAMFADDARGGEIIPQGAQTQPARQPRPRATLALLSAGARTR